MRCGQRTRCKDIDAEPLSAFRGAIKVERTAHDAQAAAATLPLYRGRAMSCEFDNDEERTLAMPRSKSRSPRRRRSPTPKRGRLCSRSYMHSPTPEKRDVVKKKRFWTPSSDDGFNIPDVDYGPLVVPIAATAVAVAVDNDAVDVVAEAVPEQQEEGPCTACVRIVDDLKRHVESDRADGPVAVQKATIRAWFECHYAMGVREGENSVSVARTTVLQWMHV